MPVMPTHARRRIGGELRRLRTRAELTVDQVVGSLGWSRTKLIRIESARVSLESRDLVRLYGLFEATSEEIARLSGWLEDARDYRWWQEYSNLISLDLEEFLSLESQATSIRFAGTGIFPGLLQSLDYARAVYASTSIVPDPDQADALVEVRVKRRRVFDDEGVTVSAVIGAGLLHVQTGGVQVLHGQLTHLLKLGENPRIRIQVIPFEAPAAVMSGGITLFDFSEEFNPPVAYAEHQGGMTAFDGALDVRRMRLNLDHLEAQALSPEASIKLIATRMEEL